MRCEKCGTSLKEGAKFCPNCGEKVSAQPDANNPDQAETPKNICHACGAELKEGLKFCLECGEKIDGSAPKPKSVPQPEATAGLVQKSETESIPEPVQETSSEPTPQPVKVSLGKEKEEKKNTVSLSKKEETSLSEKDNAPVNETPAAEEPSNKCQKCGNSLKPNAKFCPVCGSKVGETPVPVNEIPATEEPSNKCQKCGNLLKPNAKFCPVCGNKVGETPAPVNETPAAEELANKCQKCGNLLKPNAKFCPVCGNKAGEVPNTPPLPAPVPGQVSPPPVQNQGMNPNFPQNPAMAVPKKPIDKKKAGIIAGIAGGAILILVIVLLIINRTPRINLNDYITVEYTGYNSYGTASVKFDKDRFKEDWKGKLKYNSVDQNDLISYLIDFSDDPADNIASAVNYSYSLDKKYDLSNDQKIKLTWSISSAKKILENYIKCELIAEDMELTVNGLQSISNFDPFDESKFKVSYTGYNGKGRLDYERDYSLYYEFDKTSGLSNGDTITVTVSAPSYKDITAYCAENMGAVPSRTSMTLTVSGLEEMGGFDPFEGISVDFEGIAPNGKAQIVNNSEKYLKYSLDKEKNLSNGDKVIVTVSAPYGEDLNEYCKEQYEATPNSTTKEFTVSGLSKYVTEINDIPKDTLDSMKFESVDQIKSNVSSEGEEFINAGYQGMIILNIKDGKYAGYNMYDHMYYLVYKVTVKVQDYDKKQKEYSFWTYCAFHNMTILDDGTCSIDTADVTRPSERVAPKEAAFSYYGYEKYDSLFSKVVTSKLNNFKYVTDIAGSTPQVSEEESSQPSSAESSKESSKAESSAETSRAA